MPETKSLAGPTPGEPAGPDAPRRKGRPRDAGADARILSAAARLILTRGYDHMTIDQVAAEAGAGKATVYRRWAGKEDLAFAALEQLYSSEVPVPDTGAVRSDLHALFTSVVTFANSSIGHTHVRTILAEALRDERLGELYASALASQEQAARTIFQRGIDRGEVRADAPLEVVESWISGLIVLSAAANRPLPGADEVDAMVQLLLNGIGTGQH